MSRAYSRAAKAAEGSLDRIEHHVVDQTDLEGIPYHLREMVVDRIKSDRFGVELAGAVFIADNAEQEGSSWAYQRNADFGDPEREISRACGRAYEDLSDALMQFVLIEIRELIGSMDRTPEPEEIELLRWIDEQLEEDDDNGGIAA